MFNYLLNMMSAVLIYSELAEFVMRECSVLIATYESPQLYSANITPQPSDPLSIPLFPSDIPAATPVAIKPDGNCLPRCGFLPAFGCQDYHEEMCVRIVCELITHRHLYLADEFLAKGLSAHPTHSRVV